MTHFFEQAEPVHTLAPATAASAYDLAGGGSGGVGRRVNRFSLLEKMGQKSRKNYRLLDLPLVNKHQEMSGRSQAEAAVAAAGV